MDYQVVVHAGGEGTRLRPYTLEKPKALLDVNGKTLIEIALKPFLDAGIKKFVFTASYKADMMRGFFENNFPDLDVSFIDEPKPAGRAGAVKFGIEQGKLDPDKLTIITAADDLIEVDVPKLIASHKASRAKSTIVISKTFANPFGVVHYSANKITKFEEKPQTSMPENQAVNTGMKVFSDLKLFLDVPVPSHEEYVIFPKLAEQNDIGVFFSDSWRPINTKDEYHKLIKED
jgi:NDP-sugar pyrophosphorylase family protein